jgi:hypothetical protein
MDVISRFEVDGSGLSCEGCGLKLADRALRVPGIGGAHCSVACIEVHLFGFQACRWCGSKMEKTYTGIDSRLCSEDCSANYYAKAAPSCGDGSATVGMGRRFMLWLQRNQPALSRKMTALKSASLKIAA